MNVLKIFYEKLGNFSIIAQSKEIDVSRKSASQRALGNRILREGLGHYLRKHGIREVNEGYFVVQSPVTDTFQS